MPIFSYKCEKCANTFDLLEGMTARKADKKCPSCGSEKVEKMLSSFSVGSSSGGSVLHPAPSYPTGTCSL